MAIADRTFSFRAPSDLRERLAHAERAYAALAEDADTAGQITRELEIRLQRRLHGAGAGDANQGRILRAVVEAFIEATESAERDAALVEELRAFDAADRTGEGERRALRERSAAVDQH